MAKIVKGRRMRDTDHFDYQVFRCPVVGEAYLSHEVKAGDMGATPPNPRCGPRGTWVRFNKERVARLTNSVRTKV